MAAAVRRAEGGGGGGRADALRDIAISPQVSIYVTDDVAAARDRERPHIAFYIGGMGVFYHQYMHRIGFGADADRVRAAFAAKRARSARRKLVTDEMVDAMTILGTPEAVPRADAALLRRGRAGDPAGLQRARTRTSYLAALRAVAPPPAEDMRPRH